MLIKSTLIRKVVVEAGKFGYSKLLKEYDAYKVLAGLKIAKPIDSHERLYIHTVLLFAALGKPEEYIRLILLKSCSDAFKQELVHGNVGAFVRELEHQLHTDQNIRIIKEWNQIPDGDVDHFFAIYNKLVKDVAAPSALSMLNKQEEMAQSFKLQFDKQNALTEMMLKEVRSLGLGTNEDAIQKEYRTQISEVTEELENGSAEKALFRLRKLKDRIWDNVSEQLKFTLLTNIGIGHYKLHQNNDAAEALIEAYGISPDTETSLSNVVNAYMAIDDRENTLYHLRLFLKKFPKSIGAHACRIKVFANNETLDELQQKVPKKILKNPEIIASLGMAARNRGEFDVAIRLLNDAHLANPKDDFIEKHLLQAYLEKYARNYKVLNMKILDGQTADDLELLLKIIYRQQKKSKETDNKIEQVNLFLSEGFVLSLTKKIPDALAALDRGLYLDPVNPNLLKQKGYIYAFEGKVELAIAELSKISDFALAPDVPCFLAECHRNNGNIGKGIKILEKVLRGGVISGILADHFTNQATHILLDMYILDGRRAKVEELGGKHFQGEHVLDKISAARIAYFLGEGEKGAELLRKACGLINDKSTYQEKFFLASDLQRHQLFSEAIEIYSLIVDPEIDSEPNRMLCKLLWDHAQMGQALTMLRQLRQANGVLEIPTRFEMECYQQIADYARATEIAEEYLKAFPANDEVRLILGGLYYRTGRPALQKSLLDVPMNYLELNAGFLQTYLAQLAGVGRREQAIDIAYEYQRIKDSEEASTIFQQTVLFYPFRKERDVPVTADIDCAVTLSREDIKFTLILEDRDSMSLKKNEINLSHQRFEKIFGKSVGEEVSFGNTDRWYITSIVHKTKYAFDLGRQDQETVYADSSKMRWFKIDDIKKNLEENPELLQKQRQTSENAFNLTFKPYKQHEVSLFMLAKSMGVNLISVRDQVIAMKKVGIQCSEGERQTIEQIKEKIENRQLCADITTLLAVFELGLQERIFGQFGKILVVPATVDIVLNALEDGRSFRPDGNPSQPLIALKNFIDTYCEEVFPLSLLELNANDKSASDDIVGKSVLDTYLLCSEKQGVYLSDDFVCRESYKAGYDAPVMWTQDLLVFFHAEGQITRDVLSHANIELVKRNYQYVSLDSHTLYTAFKLFGGKDPEKLLACLEMLSGVRSTEDSAIVVAFHYMILGWRDLTMEEGAKEYLTDQALILFTFGRNPARAIAMWREILAGGFKTLISVSDEVYVEKIKTRLERLVQQLMADGFPKGDRD
ncbi:tetratricopeptide repeat protein [Pedobacter sp.]